MYRLQLQLPTSITEKTKYYIRLKSRVIFNHVPVSRIQVNMYITSGIFCELFRSIHGLTVDIFLRGNNSVHWFGFLKIILFSVTYFNLFSSLVWRYMMLSQLYRLQNSFSIRILVIRFTQYRIRFNWLLLIR